MGWGRGVLGEDPTVSFIGFQLLLFLAVCNYSYLPMYLVLLATVFFVYCSKHWWFVVGIPVYRHLDFSFLWSAKSVTVSLPTCHFPKLIDLSNMLLYPFLFFLVGFYSMIILLPLHQVLEQQEKWTCVFNPKIILNSLIPKT